MKAGQTVSIFKIEPKKGDRLRKGVLMFDVEVGTPVIVVEDDDRFIRTSRVQAINKVEDKFLLTTRNSTYEIEVLQ